MPPARAPRSSASDGPLTSVGSTLERSGGSAPQLQQLHGAISGGGASDGGGAASWSCARAIAGCPTHVATNPSATSTRAMCHLMNADEARRRGVKEYIADVRVRATAPSW